MWPFKLLVKCIDCGYLIDDGHFAIKCHRGENIVLEIRKEKSVYNFGPTSNDAVNHIVNDLVDNAVWAKISKDKPRQCYSYFKKIKGLMPAEHLEHQLYKGPGVSLSKRALFWSIIAVLISAGALIVSMRKP